MSVDYNPAFAMALNTSYGNGNGNVYDRADNYSFIPKENGQEKNITVVKYKSNPCVMALILLALSLLILGSVGACTYFVFEVEKLKSGSNNNSYSFNIQEFNHLLNSLNQEVHQLINSSNVFLHEQIRQLSMEIQRLSQNTNTSNYQWESDVQESNHLLHSLNQEVHQVINSSNAFLHEQIRQLFREIQQLSLNMNTSQRENEIDVQEMNRLLHSLNQEVYHINNSNMFLQEQVRQLSRDIQRLSQNTNANHQCENEIDSISTLIRNLHCISVDQNYSMANDSTNATSSCLLSSEPIFDANLTRGQHSIAPDSGITWARTLTDPNSQTSCDMQGVLRIVFPPPRNNTQTRRLQFDLYFSDTRSGWIFNIGDSTNDGYGGDAGHTSNAAEVHNIGESFFVQTNTLPGYTNYTTTHLLVENTPNALSDHVTVTIGDEYVKFDNNRGIQKTYQSRYLFTLRGQPTTYGPVDYTIYFSMNRVIYHFSSTSRTGTGLCRAVIRALEC